MLDATMSTSLTKPPLEILHYTFNNKGKTYKYM